MSATLGSHMHSNNNNLDLSSASMMSPVVSGSVTQLENFLAYYRNKTSKKQCQLSVYRYF